MPPFLPPRAAVHQISLRWPSLSLPARFESATVPAAPAVLDAGRTSGGIGIRSGLKIRGPLNRAIWVQVPSRAHFTKLRMNRPNSGRRGARMIRSPLQKRVFAFAFLASFAANSAYAKGTGLAGLDAIYPELDALYIDLHQNPELSGQESKTAAK